MPPKKRKEDGKYRDHRDRNNEVLIQTNDIKFFNFSWEIIMFPRCESKHVTTCIDKH